MVLSKTCLCNGVILTAVTVLVTLVATTQSVTTIMPTSITDVSASAPLPSAVGQSAPINVDHFSSSNALQVLIPFDCVCVCFMAGYWQGYNMHDDTQVTIQFVSPLFPTLH